MKNKETLEEAAKKYASKIWDYSDSNEKTLHANCKKAFIQGAKWQENQDPSGRANAAHVKADTTIAKIKIDIPV